MRRNKVGIAGLTKDIAHKERLQKQAEEIQEVKVAQVQEQLAKFKDNLGQFAAKYKKSINKDPIFRAQFNDLCKTIGVDPLASSKGFWVQLLGVGDFYYELAVQIVEVCLQTRSVNGGLIEIEVLKSMLIKKRGFYAKNISVEDIERAVAKLAVLGSGFDIKTFGKRRIIQSVPMELFSDHTAILGVAQEKGWMTENELRASLSWSLDRINKALGVLLAEGIVWVDEQSETQETLYWLSSVQCF